MNFFARKANPTEKTARQKQVVIKERHARWQEPVTASNETVHTVETWQAVCEALLNWQLQQIELPVSISAVPSLETLLTALSSENSPAKAISQLQTVYDESLALQGTNKQMLQQIEASNRQTATLSSSYAQVNSSIQNLTYGLEQMNTSIQEIARSTNQAAQTTTHAQQVTEEAQSRIEALDQAIQKIGKILVLINKIASQTNLLSLNATIEAATAGEVGRGFAVVAHEIKNLAKQCQTATEDIASQIEDVQLHSEKTTKAIEAILEVIRDVNHYNVTIAGAVEEQSVTTAEISNNVHEAASGCAEIHTSIGLLAESSEKLVTQVRDLETQLTAHSQSAKWLD